MKKYAGFGDSDANTPGHYLALNVKVPEGATVTTKIEGGTNSSYVDLTEDKFCVYRIKNTSQKIKIKTLLNGDEVEKTYDLTGLKLVEFPVGADAVTVDSTTDFGDCGKASQWMSEVGIKWNGINGEVTGTFNKSKGKSTSNTYQFAMKLDEYFRNKNVNVHLTADSTWTDCIGHVVLTNGADSIIDVTLDGTALAHLTFNTAHFNN